MIVGTKPEVHVLIIGAPASGKGTLCKKLSEDYGFYHLSVGDLIRQALNDRTNHALDEAREEAMKRMKEGTLLATEVLVPIMTAEIGKQRLSGHRRFLIDGFPRRLDQAASFAPHMIKPMLVIHVQCPRDVALNRYLSRKLPGRLDDDEELFHRRYHHYLRHNDDISAHYRAMGVLVEIDSSGDTQSTYERLVQLLREHEIWKMFHETAG
ncbi:cytidine monophosphate (UMP-CMP) kinase 1, cytosolic [Xylographa opegraphella]|nr:cytidine monophosphate (UMP-CMP) kinase 1, cytosolic [Xylographa opegraphella]